MKITKKQKRRRGRPQKKQTWNDKPLVPGYELPLLLIPLFQEFARILYLYSTGDLERDPLKTSLFNKLLKLAHEHNEQMKTEYSAPSAAKDLLPQLKFLYKEIEKGKITSLRQAKNYVKKNGIFLPKRFFWMLFQSSDDLKKSGLRSLGDLAAQNVARALAGAKDPRVGRKLAKKGLALDELYGKWDFSSLNCVAFIIDILFEVSGPYLSAVGLAKSVIKIWTAQLSDPKLAPLNRLASTAIFDVLILN